jgi:hypothetical protein
MADQRKILGVFVHFPQGTQQIAFAGAGVDEDHGCPFVDEHVKDGGLRRHFNVPYTFELSPPNLVQPVAGVLKS